MFTTFIAPVSIDRRKIAMKKSSLWKFKKIILAFLFASTLSAFADRPIYSASFADFDRRARSSEKTVSVVFFGGSLTWGDGASDPERTSFRGLMQSYLRAKYPNARFAFTDAAIGGTGSKLGMFRVAPDVLSHNPDLVFLDFTTEDGLAKTDRQSLASYERILRDLIGQGVPVLEVLFGAKNYFAEDWSHLGPPRYRDHLEMGNLYHTGIGNSFPILQNFFRTNSLSREEIWPEEDWKASDVGHQIYFETARAGLEQAIREKRLCNFPLEPVFADEYKKRFQLYPGTSALPSGWHSGKTLRPNSDTRENANHWISEIAIAGAKDVSDAVSLKVQFNGTFVGILGEAKNDGLGFRVFVDEEPVPYQIRPRKEIWPTSTVPWGGGTRFFWYEISDKLSPGRHILEILPVAESGETGELRIESICVAGPGREVMRLTGDGATKF